ncbi:hypothetical protein V6Z11_D13G061600 [Gossypium hirsutum]
MLLFSTVLDPRAPQFESLIIMPEQDPLSCLLKATSKFILRLGHSGILYRSISDPLPGYCMSRQEQTILVTPQSRKA